MLARPTPGLRSSAMTEITLASRSPQRRAILEQLGIPFRVVEPDVEELSEGDESSGIPEPPKE